jgi:molybdate transport system ATP-binding protein
VTSLVAAVAVRRGSFHLQAHLAAESGETLALLGPNGSGKSTLVGALAGLVPLEEGEVRVGDSMWESTAGRVRLRPQMRSTGVVFQGLLLFPALSAIDNVAYGLRARGTPGARARARGLEVMERLHIAHLAERDPGTLSGGEAQRVALARALATEPDLLLLDEPLSALDVANRPEARRALREALDSFPGVKLLVTHEPLEAMALADRLVVLEGGRVVQSGTPADIRARPRSRYTASLVGLNLLSGVVVAEGAQRSIDTGEGRVAIGDRGLSTGTRVLATVHPRAITIGVQPRRPSSSARNVFEATVAGMDLVGDRVRVSLDSRPPLTAEITTEALDELDLARAQRVWASVKATQIEVYPA